MPTRDEVLEGGGPWTFEAPTLDPGESYYIDFRNVKFNGQKGWFRKWLPLDYAQITNLDTGNAVEVTYNSRFSDFVVPNAIETFDNQGITKVRVRNSGGSTIAADDVKIAVGKDPYDADNAAREQRKGGSWSPRKALNDLIPGGNF